MRPVRLSRRSFVSGAALTAIAFPHRKLFAQSAAATASTPSGPLRGEETASGVRIFKGVPYAEPPTGSLRFRPPVRVKPWTMERSATHFASSAMQVGDRLKQSEDCLYLNVWAPKGKGPFPIYVWIHGGAFMTGSPFDTIFDGTKFAEEGIVCVTIAYRLGALGFMDLEPLLGASYAGSANNGLRDIIAALDWVKENVEAFGGDPARVTVGGQSAGAKLTGLLMGVPSAQPLFRQAIVESGGADRAWPKDISAAVGAGFGGSWRAQTSKDNAALLTADSTEIIETQKVFLEQWPRHFPFRAEIDGSLLPASAVETVANGSMRGKRMLIGTNRDESATFLGPHPANDPEAANLSVLSLAKFDTVWPRYKTLYPEMSDEVRRIRAVTAEEYLVPSVRLADAQVKGGGEAWMYELEFTESTGRLQGYSYHGLELGLAWDKPKEKIADEVALAGKVHPAWLAFLQGKAPASAGLPAWPQYRAGERPTMIFDVNPHVEMKPQEAELRLWDGVL